MSRKVSSCDRTLTGLPHLGLPESALRDLDREASEGALDSRDLCRRLSEVMRASLKCTHLE